MHRRLTTEQFQRENKVLYYRGYHVRHYCAWVQGGITNWTVIWISEYTCQDARAIDVPIQKYMAKWGIHGLSLAIMYRHRLVFASGYGYIDNLHTQRVEPHHLFRIASVSKWLTAVAIMRLIQDNKIGLDSTVFGPGSILAALTRRKRLPPSLCRVTVQHLLEHTGADTAGGDTRVPDDVKDTAEGKTLYYIRRWLPSHPMQHEPGVRFEYSNWGYVFLAVVIEHVTHMAYEDYIRNRVFGEKPRIFVPHDYQRLPDESWYYKSPSVFEPEYPWVGVGDNGPSSWVAEPKSLLRLLAQSEGVDGERALTRETFELMRRPSRAQSRYGKGLLLGGTGQKCWAGHNGMIQGTLSWLIRRDDGVSYMATVNTTGGDAQGDSSRELYHACQRAVDGVKHWPSWNLFEG